MPPADPAIVLDRRARPRGAQVLVIAVGAISAGAAAAWLARAVDSDPDPGWTIALPVGAAVAAMVAWFAMSGTRITIDDQGTLVYSLQGRRNLALDLRDVSEIRPVADGLTVGAGLVLPEPGKVRFLHKAGVSPERMRRWRAALGVDLLLEGFQAGDVAAIEAIRVGLAAAPGVGRDGP